jgi:hypothetical protein
MHIFFLVILLSLTERISLVLLPELLPRMRPKAGNASPLTHTHYRGGIMNPKYPGGCKVRRPGLKPRGI